MPEHLTIGTKKAFKNNYAFPYTKHAVGGETIYVCRKGSDYARANEVLVLRCQEGTWTAYDSDVSADGGTLHMRQAVFRCRENITEPGWHCWQMNDAAGPEATSQPAEWQGALWAETRVP